MNADVDLRCGRCDDPLGFDDELDRARAGVLVCGACLDLCRYLEVVASDPHGCPRHDDEED